MCGKVIYKMRIIQVLDALDYGDGVSNDVINKKHLLKKMGYDTEIYSKWCDERVLDERLDINLLATSSEDIIIHHYSGESNIISKVLNQRGKKILFYHNITPEEFWDDGEFAKKGIRQLETLGVKYDYIGGDSKFNIKDLRELGLKQEADVLPILVNFNHFPTANAMCDKNSTCFLFVGRVAPNKCHDDIIKVFDYYFNNIDANSELYLVGNYEAYPEYFSKLKKQLEGLACSSHIIFAGKVSNEMLYQYYQKATAFLCMSAHEGFCIPLLESMYSGIPTFAYDAGAVSETMGNAGVLIYDKSPEKVAKTIYTILSTRDLCGEIIDRQFKWVAHFSESEIAKQLRCLIEKWSEKE